MIRIAFVGKDRASITYIAEYMRYHHKFKKRRLNDPLKAFIKKIHYFEPDKRIHWEYQRELYDAIYKVDNEFWITWYRNAMKTTTANVVCDDARYMNEAKALRDLGFKIVRVTAPPKKNPAIRKSLGRSAAPGTLFLNELYSKDFTKELKVDYSIHRGDNESTKRAMDTILEDIRAKAS